MDYNFKIKFDQYKLLDKINPEFLDTIIEDIFNTGYNIWVKNYIKNDVIAHLNNTNSTNTQELNNITENKQSSAKGQSGENIVIDIVKDKFPDTLVENTSRIPHSGDIQLTLSSKSKIILEVKNYNKTIDLEQIDKLKFDMKFSNIYYALFISLNSGIVGKKRFEIETFYYNKHYYYIMYIPYSMHKIIPNRKYTITHNPLEDSVFNLSTKLEYSICVMTTLSENIYKNIRFKNYNISNSDIDFLINKFEKFYDEFRIVKASALRLEENIKKSIDSHLSVLKEYENNIKSNINKLISKKLDINIFSKPPNFVITTNKILELNDGLENYDILYLGEFVGKIIKIKNCYDLLVVHNGRNYHDFFDDYNECINFLYSL